MSVSNSTHTRVQSQTWPASAVAVCVTLCVITVLALMALFITNDVTGEAAPKPPTEVMNTASNPDSGQPCNYLDYDGDPSSPDRIILWCEAGTTPLAINTKGLERAIWSDGRVTGDGSTNIDVRGGAHHAYKVTIVQAEDGTVDYRVWYDDVKETTNADGEVTGLQSRVTMRTFDTEAISQTRALGY